MRLRAAERVTGQGDSPTRFSSPPTTIGSLLRSPPAAQAPLIHDPRTIMARAATKILQGRPMFHLLRLKRIVSRHFETALSSPGVVSY